MADVASSMVKASPISKYKLCAFTWYGHTTTY